MIASLNLYFCTEPTRKCRNHSVCGVAHSNRLLALVACAFFACAGCEHPYDAERRVQALYNKAIDPSLHFSERIKAGRLLDASRKERLRQHLLAELPGAWDRKTLDAITLLGDVGDQRCMVALEELDRQRFNVSGKIGVAIHFAIERIKEREKTK